RNVVKETLQAGLKVTRRYDVDKDKTIGHMGDDLRVYATPMMVMDVERTCLELMAEHADEGESSVGARVEIDHMGPTLMNMWIEVRAEVVEVKGPKVVFDVEIHDALEQIGRAHHVRFMLDMEGQKGRLEKKAAKAKEAGAL
ncbi:MAG: hotdog domain-containing protein, partial [Alphaproteobacteria bacterium]|nr:hotdog domain-containing protein [Alphaproteobacteria bacterium]